MRLADFEEVFIRKDDAWHDLNILGLRVIVELIFV